MTLSLARSSLVGLIGLMGAAWACGSSVPPPLGGNTGSAGTGQGGSSSGSQGSLGGPCYANGTCNTGLACLSGVICGPATGTGGDTGQAQGTLYGSCFPNATCNTGLTCTQNLCLPDAAGTGGSTGLTPGTLDGPCLTNNTCNSGLMCTAGYCIPSVGAGGSSGQGGAAQGGAGNSSQGGSSQGGASASGGTSAGGTSTGGTNAGGTNAGGTSTGGTSTGGTSTGGTSTGGTSTGGSSGAASTLIVASDGDVAPGSNSVGVSGAWFTFAAMKPVSTIVSSFVGSNVCVSGMVVDTDAFGPTLALNLNQPSATGTAGSYVPSAHGITGFSFEISGTPTNLQVSYLANDTAQSEYCRSLTPSTTVPTAVSVASTSYQCWIAGGAAGNPSTAYVALRFQVVTDTNRPTYTYNFCITNLRAILAAGA